MRFAKRLAAPSLALALGTAFAGAAGAQTVAALSGDTTLTMFDAGSRKVSRTVNVTGAPGRLLGIDVRPADGLLYGLAADGSIVTIDAATGRATVKSKLDTTLKSGVAATVDFNPVADRLRILGTDGTSLRANVDDGKVTTDGSLKYAEADASKGKTPVVVAGAYVNSMKGAKETTLYDIDASTGAFLRQAPPNDGVLATIGSLGLPAMSGDAAGRMMGFDISTDASGAHTGWLIAGTTLYRVDVGSGKASPAGTVEGLPTGVRDIAILPN